MQGVVQVEQVRSVVLRPILLRSKRFVGCLSINESTWFTLRMSVRGSSSRNEVGSGALEANA